LILKYRSGPEKLWGFSRNGPANGKRMRNTFLGGLGSEQVDRVRFQGGNQTREG